MIRKSVVFFALTAGFSFAHHGVASLGAVGLRGPGAPLETSTSATLPQGSWLFYTKLDNAKWKRYSFQQFPDQQNTSSFWMFGIGYGLKPWLSLYIFTPYTVKKELKSLEGDSAKGQYTYTTAGFTDILVTAVVGFKYYKGFQLIPRRESLDDLMDWHFTLYTTLSIPTGDPNVYDKARHPQGEFEPSMATGYGTPTVTFGFTTTKQFVSFPKLTFIMDTSYLRFFENTYNFKEDPESPKKNYKFGDEFRLNTALSYRLYTNMQKKFRADAILEMNFLHIQRDEEDGQKLRGSGGSILYNTTGLRLYYKNFSIGAGLKLPVWKDLNEENEQQGSEGKEKYRIILTITTLL